MSTIHRIPVNFQDSLRFAPEDSSRLRELVDILTPIAARYPRTGQLGNCLRQLDGICRFLHVFLITRFKRTAPVCLTGVGGESNSWSASTLFERISTDFANEAVTVFTRQSNVGYENVRPEAF
jgi:hypothetical protein